MDRWNYLISSRNNISAEEQNTCAWLAENPGSEHEEGPTAKRQRLDKMATTEDFDQNAIGFIGDSSEIIWLQRLAKELGFCDNLYSFNAAYYHTGYRGSPVSGSLSTTHRPAYKVTCGLFDRYAASVYVSFPTVNVKPFQQQLETFYQMTGSPPQKNFLIPIAPLAGHLLSDPRNR
ncbi:hypothetical protein BJY00DRAFT_158936 [Aspergillus carlsbadensis]|nr:hypothetical protein BJY00DRAFT_158936 [Aspergillus carlsbadensis]